MPKNNKKLSIPAPVVAKRVPAKATSLPPSDGLLRVRLGRLDLDGPWCLTREPGDLMKVLAAIKSWETMRTLDAFGGHPGKDYALKDLPNKDAHRRLAELNLDDQESICRMRVDGPGRLYGFRQNDDFWALWWDPRHEIWPSAR